MRFIGVFTQDDQALEALGKYGPAVCIAQDIVTHRPSYALAVPDSTSDQAAMYELWEFVHKV